MNLILILLLISIPFIGMFYFMTQVKNGSIILSEKSWHFKMLHYMWDVDSKNLWNMCPYYWNVVLSVLFFIPYHVIKYYVKIIDISGKFISDLFQKKKVIQKENNYKEAKSKKEWIKIPTTQKEIFKFIWNKGFEIFKYIILITLVLALLTCFSKLFFDIYKLSTTVFYTIIGIIIYFITLELLSHFLDLKEKTIEPWANLFKSIFNIFFLPLYLIFLGLKKVFNIYTDICPSINWKENEYC